MEYSNDLGKIALNPSDRTKLLSDQYITNVQAMPRDRKWNVNNSLMFGALESRLGTWYASEDTIAVIKYVQSDAFRKSESSTKRAEILDTAKKLTTSDRNSTYGEPIDHLSHVADILNAYGYRGPGGRKIQAYDAPIFQIIVKLSRLNNGPAHMDSWTDISGYAAIGGEVAAIEADNESR